MTGFLIGVIVVLIVALGFSIAYFSGKVQSAEQEGFNKGKEHRRKEEQAALEAAQKQAQQEIQAARETNAQAERLMEQVQHPSSGAQ